MRLCVPCDLGAVPVVTATPCICSPNAAGAIASRAAPVQGGQCQLQGNTTETSGLVAISSAPIFPLLTADICEYQKAMPGWGTAGGVSSPWHLKAAWQLLLRPAWAQGAGWLGQCHWHMLRTRPFLFHAFTVSSSGLEVAYKSK